MNALIWLGGTMWNMGKSVAEARKLAKEDSDGWNGEYRDVGSVDLSPVGDALMTHGFNEWALTGSIMQSLANTAARAIYKGSVNKHIDFLPDDLLNL